MIRLPVLVFALAALCLSPVARAAEEPQATSATYGAWTLRCATPASQPATKDTKTPATPAGPQPGVKQCEIGQAIQVQGQQAPIVQIAIGRADKDDSLRLVIQVPVGAWLPAGVTLQFADKSEPVSLTYKRCLPGACLSDIDLSPNLRDAMKTGQKDAKVTFQLVAGKDVTVPMSFKGFDAAFAAMDQALK